MLPRIRLHLIFTLLSTIGILQSTYSQVLRIDHVILVDTDLNKKCNDFNEMGFSIKQGRSHENGLINAHIKFKNNSSLELMSLEGDPKDEVAKDYESLINKGVKGAYLALTGPTRSRIETLLKNLNLQYRVTAGNLWTYISFPKHSGFEHIFFIIYHFDQKKPENLAAHLNGFDKIQNVTIEGSPSLITLLESFDLIKENSSQDYTKFNTKTGNITINPLIHNERPGIKEIIFGNEFTEGTLQIKLN